MTMKDKILRILPRPQANAEELLKLIADCTERDEDDTMMTLIEDYIKKAS